MRRPFSWVTGRGETKTQLGEEKDRGEQRGEPVGAAPGHFWDVSLYKCRLSCVLSHDTPLLAAYRQPGRMSARSVHSA